jgi:hypothetical protein
MIMGAYAQLWESWDLFVCVCVCAWAAVCSWNILFESNDGIAMCQRWRNGRRKRNVPSPLKRGVQSSGSTSRLMRTRQMAISHHGMHHRITRSCHLITFSPCKPHSSLLISCCVWVCVHLCASVCICVCVYLWVTETQCCTSCSHVVLYSLPVVYI